MPIRKMKPVKKNKKEKWHRDAAIVVRGPMRVDPELARRVIERTLALLQEQDGKTALREDVADIFKDAADKAAPEKAEIAVPAAPRDEAASAAGIKKSPREFI